MSQWGRLLELVAALVSVGAGVYLLSKGTAPIEVGGASGESWFQVLAHGIGIYFIARGIWMFSQLGMQRSANEALERLVDLSGGWASDGDDVD